MANDKAKAVIWIASYPKSGNTWVQSVVRRAGIRYGFPKADVDVYRLIAEKREPDVVNGIRPKVSSMATTVLKTHARHTPDQELHSQLRLKMAGFVHVRRNPLDVLLSYINFTRVQYERRKDSTDYQDNLFLNLLGFDKAVPYEDWVNVKLEDIPRLNLDYALRRFAELETAIPGMSMTGGSWMAHCKSWFEAGKTLPSVFFRYEDLLKGPEYFLPLNELFTFSSKEIVEAVNSINEGQKKLQYKKIFFNKMTSYYYQQFFSASAINEFLLRFEDDLKRLGYGDLPEYA